MPSVRTIASVALAAAIGAALAPAAMSAEPPPIPAEALEKAEWYVVIDGAKVGPLTESAMLRKLEEGAIGDDTLVWREGMQDWQRAAEAPGIVAARTYARMREPGRFPRARHDNAFAMLDKG